MKKMGFEEKVTFDYSPALGFINREELAGMAGRLYQVHQVLHEKTGPGQDYLGWLEWPLLFATGMSLPDQGRGGTDPKKQSEALVVVGIGGSYLGARAGLEMLLPATAGRFPPGGVRCFASHQLSPASLERLLNYLQRRVFHKCYLQIRNDHRTGGGFPVFTPAAGGNTGKAALRENLCYHR